MKVLGLDNDGFDETDDTAKYFDAWNFGRTDEDSNFFATTALNDPTQSEQVDETCGSGRVVLYLKSLGMTAFFEDITPKQI